jgi:phosphoglycolate phosphatase-like HAD superfamily hydrolase
MTLDTSRVRALCFDVDGTLRDTDDQFVMRLARWLQPVRFLFTNNDPRPFARWAVMKTEGPGRFAYGLPDRLGVDGALARLGDWVYHLGAGRGPENFQLIHGIRSMLAHLQRDYPMAIITARGERTTLTFLEHSRLQPFFQCVAHAQTCWHTKPYPDQVLWAAKQMGVPPESCLMIGDTVPDIQAGKAAGAQTVGVLCGFGELEELQQAGAHLILNSTPELVHYLPGQGAK